MTNREKWRSVLGANARSSQLEIDLDDPPPLFDFAIELLESDRRLGRASDFTQSLLHTQCFLRACALPGVLELPEAVRVAKLVQEFEPIFDAKILQFTIGSKGADGASLEEMQHVLALLDEFTDATRLVPILMRIQGRPELAVRRLATKIIARAIPNRAWFDRQIKDPDPVIRSSVLEGLSKVEANAVPDYVVSALRAACKDPHRRVAMLAEKALSQLRPQEVTANAAPSGTR